MLLSGELRIELLCLHQINLDEALQNLESFELSGKAGLIRFKRASKIHHSCKPVCKNK